MSLTIRCQHRAKRGVPHDGWGEAVTTRDTPLAKLLELPHNMTAGASRADGGRHAAHYPPPA